MTRPVALGRLRDLARQRAIRRPLLVAVPDEPTEPESQAPARRVEWPIES